MIYLILLALGALDSAGYSIIAPVVPAIADETGAGPAAMGALVAMFGVGMALGFGLAGKGVQLRDASFVLRASLLLMAVGSLGFVFGESYALYVASRFLMGLGSGGLWIGTTFALLERFEDRRFQRLTALLAVYSVGSLAGPGLGAIGGIRGPFLAFLGLVVAALLAVLAIGRPHERVAFSSDRGVLRVPSFWLSAAGILLVALTLGTLEGVMPLHFDTLLSQAGIGALYVGLAVLVGSSAMAAGYLPPRPTLAASTVMVVVGIGLAGATGSLAWWGVALALAGIGFGIGEAGAMGILLDTVGTERIVFAMVIWSQVWALGYLAGPAAGGGVVEAFGFGAIGLVPLAAAMFVLAAFAFAGRRRAAAAAT